MGLTDAHSWINEAGQGPDYPLLFDVNYQPKPAYWGVMDALLGRWTGLTPVRIALTILKFGLGH